MARAVSGMSGHWDDELDDSPETDEPIACPECDAAVHGEAEACHACGYWITDADRSAAWDAGSATGRIKTAGLWVLGAAFMVWLILWAS